MGHAVGLVALSAVGHRVRLDLQADPRRLDGDDVVEPVAAQRLGQRHQRVALRGIGLFIDDQDGAGVRGLVLREGRRPLDGRRDAQAATGRRR